MSHIQTFNRRVGLALGLAWALSSLAAHAQTANAGPAIELVVLFPAGSSADVSARILAEGLAKHLNQPVVVSNKPGAGGSVGYKYVASSAPDGRTLVWSSNSISTNFHTGTMDINYRAFLPVARVNIEIPVLAVRSASPWNTLPEFLAHVRANPGRVSVGNSGSGSHTHMAAIALLEAGGAKAIHVPFSASQVMPSLLGGHIDAVVQLPAAVVPHVKSGTLRALGVLSDHRDPVFPDVPTAREQQVAAPAMDLWRGIHVPAGTPPKIIARLEKAVEFAMSRPEFISAGQKLGFVPSLMNPIDFGLLVARGDAEIGVQMSVLGLKKTR